MTRKEEKALKKQEKRLKKVIPLFARWEAKGIDWRSIAILQGGFTLQQVNQVDEFLSEYKKQKGDFDVD